MRMNRSDRSSLRLHPSISRREHARNLNHDQIMFSAVPGWHPSAMFEPIGQDVAFVFGEWLLPRPLQNTICLVYIT